MVLIYPLSRLKIPEMEPIKPCIAECFVEREVECFTGYDTYVHL